MIGVLAKNHESEVVSEFFQLFKTPWEFYDGNRSYDVAIVTQNDFSMPDAKLTIIYGSEQKSFDSTDAIELLYQSSNAILQHENIELPVYGNISSLKGQGRPIIKTKNSSQTVGLEIEKVGVKVIRVGYNLFDEVLYLLSVGQPPENAIIPTIELHISMMLNWILNAGIPLVEIPPIPDGYNFTVCLTHDVDFIGIRDHKFDHTMLGFIYRAAIVSLINVLKGKRKWKYLLINWKSVLTLPFVYLGLCRDFWFQFDRYQEIEKDLRSTFFLIPFKNRAGKKAPGRFAERRATKYDIRDIQDVVIKLMSQGCEVGVHGIDSWHDVESARQELVRISEVTGQSDIGIRMHWLYFNDNSPSILEEAGFFYDSTFGYNDAVGYRAGSAQVYKPIGVSKILELPLHIQDTALFNPQRMDLSESEAWHLCNDLIEKVSAYGGVLTILWHDRSLAPERLYEDFYLKMLEELKSYKVWFATASQVVRWSLIRRAITFEKAQFEKNILRLKLTCNDKEIQPKLQLRIYNSNIQKNEVFNTTHQTKNYIDVPLSNETDMYLNLHDFR